MSIPTARPGAVLGQFDRAVVRDGTEDLAENGGSGGIGLRFGTVVGPPPWGSTIRDGDEVIAAVFTFGVRGVMIADSKNGDLVTIQQSGRCPCRVSGPVNVGEHLSLDPANPGRLTHSNDGTGRVVATALEAASLADELPLCRLETLPLIPPDASGVGGSP